MDYFEITSLGIRLSGLNIGTCVSDKFCVVYFDSSVKCVSCAVSAEFC